jgi:4-amino-4-deoxy-L-arabinose transferase-like glycosyltransferase
VESINIKKIIIQLFGLFLLALALRLFQLYLIRNNPVFLNLLLDSRHYAEWARIITEKDWLSKGYPFMSPGYPYFLALIYLIFGHSIHVVAGIQLILGSIGCVLVYFIAQKVFANSGYRTNTGAKGLILSPKDIHLLGILSAGIAVLYGISIFYEGMLLKGALLSFCNLLLLLFLLYGCDKSSSIYLLVAGFLLGLSFFLRPNILLFIPFVLVWLWKSSAQAHIKKKLSLITCFCSGILIISILFGTRNYLINNELVLTSGHGG